MSVPLTAAATEEVHAKRWREWQVKNQHDQRRVAHRSRLVFAAIFVALALWLGSQLVSSLG
jgi:hypothetical protein